MSLPKDFWEKLPRRTDAELHEMLTHPDDYLPEALAAAKEEWAKRKHGPEKAAEIEVATQVRAATVEAKAQEPLNWPMRILTFALCFSIWPIVLAVYYHSRGYKRKASHCLWAMGAGLLWYLMLGIFYFREP
jgi:hypothetical protein